MIGSTHRIADPASTDEVPLAVVGIVPCKVSAENGPIQIGLPQAEQEIAVWTITH
jgi:hypothetical protein